MSTSTVTEAGPADLPEFVASVAELFKEDGGTHDPSMNVDWPASEGTSYYSGLLGDADCLLAVARREDEFLGHLVGKMVGPDSLRLVRFAVLESMRVRPEFRGQGVGSLLVDEFFSWAIRNGAQQASVTAYAANRGAQRFYERHGFAPMGITLRAAVSPSQTGTRSAVV